jgi:hypothetical protein
MISSSIFNQGFVFPPLAGKQTLDSLVEAQIFFLLEIYLFVERVNAIAPNPTSNNCDHKCTAP